MLIDTRVVAPPRRVRRRALRVRCLVRPHLLQACELLLTRRWQRNVCNSQQELEGACDSRDLCERALLRASAAPFVSISILLYQ
jgi:hypothetical protein